MYTLSAPRERRLLALLMLTQFTLIMDFMVVMPLGPQIMQAMKIGPAAFATVVSAYSVCAGLSGLAAATYIDRFDRRRLLLVMYALFTLSNLACAVANGYAMLIVARAFAGITGGVLGSIIMAIIADVIPQERRGAATGTVMTAFAMASVLGVPIGVLLGAHFHWSAPFWLLVALSVAIWIGGARWVPALAAHLSAERVPLSRVLPRLLSLFTEGRHLRALALTFLVMIASMLVIPFISPTLVANHGIAPDQLSWIYMAGGTATFFTARLIGRAVDRFGARRVFRVVTVASIAPVLFITHLPQVSYLVVLSTFPLFMVLISGRMIPMQSLLTTVPEASRRGAFLSVSSAVQSLGTGCGAWLGGLMLTTQADGTIRGYDTVGVVAAVVALGAAWWVGRVVSAPTPAPVALSPATSESV